MEQVEKVINYKVVEQIDIYKNINYSRTISNNKDDYFIEKKVSNEIAYSTILSLFSDSHQYNIIFPKKTIFYEQFNSSKILVENMRKITIRIKSLNKILKLANIDQSSIFMYILFYITSINLEASTENMIMYNINYDTLMNIINCFCIKHKNTEIKMPKNSLTKIIEMCGISYSERFRYMNFYEVEEKTIKIYAHRGDLKKKISKINSSSLEDIKNNESIKEIKDKNNMEYKLKKKENEISPKRFNKNKNKSNISNKSKSKTKTKSIIKKKSLIKSNSTYNIDNKTKSNSILKNKSKIKNKNLIKDNSINKKKKTINDTKIQQANMVKKSNNIKTLKYNIYNPKLNYFNTINSLKNDDEDIFERNYILNTPRKYVKYEENKESSYFKNNGNNTNNLDYSTRTSKSKRKDNIKKGTTKKSVSKRRKRIDYEISRTNSVTYLGSTSTLKQSNYKQTDSELIYPFNGYTKYTTSFAIETPEKERKSLRTRKDNDYCYYPFILRKKPELKNKTIYLCGSMPKLGSWDPLRAIKMDEEYRNGEEFFSKYIEVQKNEIPFEYKFFYYENGKINWIGNPFENILTFPQFFESLRELKKSHISIIDLNIRYINNIDGINIWDNRKHKLIELLLNKKADIFFFQEITHTQSDFIDRYLSSIYEFVGEYRDSTNTSEKCSICVNKLKYTIIHSGQFWLSSTPYIPGSNDFGNYFPRICTWASLKQIEGKNLLFMNVHLDHENKRAHLPCIKVLLEEEKKIENRLKDVYFCFIAGCFYCEENDEEIKYIKNHGYTEIMFENSFHGFTGVANHHWDYMFWKSKNKGDIIFKEAHVMKKEGTIDDNLRYYISDHFPIYAEFFHKNI